MAEIIPSIPDQGSSFVGKRCVLDNLLQVAVYCKLDNILASGQLPSIPLAQLDQARMALVAPAVAFALHTTSYRLDISLDCMPKQQVLICLE